MLRVLKVLRVRVRVLGVLGLLIAALGVWLRCAPVPHELLDAIDTPSTVIVDRHGRVLYEALGKDGSRIKPIDAAALPSLLASATIAAEDRRFYSHAGVDPMALVRAVRHNVLEGQVVEGGSTITQQVAKLLIQRREGVTRRGMAAKIRELVLALRLEHHFTKRQILALYLNLAAYGNQATGAARASVAYFGVDPSMLTPAQAAFLAALPQRPSAFNPWKNAESARNRQLAVIRRMASAGFLTPAQVREAHDERLAVRPRRNPFDAPHFVEMVRSAARSAPADRADGPQAGRIETTLDLDLQQQIEGIIEHERGSLKAHGAANVAVVVLDNRRGEWLAWEGSGDYTDVEHGGAINGPLASRQPGSALKPFTYALAFEQDKTPATVLPDIPAHFPTAEPGVIYVPRNYDGRYRGPLLARAALAGSENVPAVALASDLGVDSLLRFLARAGLSTLDRTPAYYGLGLTLGNAEVRLDELVAAYSAFARGGIYLQPTFVLPAKAASDRPRHEQRLVSERTAFWITDILSDADARAYIFGRGSSLEFPFPVAVKTGTSQAYHDNWTVGYTRNITVGVWVGNFDRTPLRDSSGVTGAGPIFHAVMLAAAGHYDAAGEESSSSGPHPGGLEEVTICALSGQRAQPWCPSRLREWLPLGANPQPCAWHSHSDEGIVTIYPAEYRAWSATQRAPAPTASAAAMASAPADRASSAMVRTPLDKANGVGSGTLTIANPAQGTVYSIDPTLKPEFQALPLRVVSSHPTSVTWLVDGSEIGTSSSEMPFEWPLVVGSHRIDVQDADGHHASTSVVVR